MDGWNQSAGYVDGGRLKRNRGPLNRSTSLLQNVPVSNYDLHDPPYTTSGVFPQLLRHLFPRLQTSHDRSCLSLTQTTLTCFLTLSAITLSHDLTRRLPQSTVELRADLLEEKRLHALHALFLPFVLVVEFFSDRGDLRVYASANTSKRGVMVKGQATLEEG